ncbi:hypothetical protein J2X56_003022 [Herbaspirillum sp. 1173]|uniref:sce7726 family protein n=1 Tax=Herbaspirillum sp. 1173 TaxID=2817734 RepID=UPI002861D47A|nr:sce7726 family protein [Herbaspirillum sp. 1173]MDR6740998.1 hypothetical protein [Herbaspirillum sp. 1173]
MSGKASLPIPEVEALRLLARIFTRSVFSALADGRVLPAAMGALYKNRVVVAGEEQPLWTFFDDAWHVLRRAYRSEYIYKTELANRIVFGKHRPSTAALHIELPVGRSIVDAAVFNGTSTAYEIKTQFDSPRRLLSQTGDYLKVFDKVFVVSHPSQALAYQEVVAPTVGILALNQKGQLTVVRDACSNRANIVPRYVFKCLRRAEYVAAIQALTNERVSEYPSALIEARCEEIFSTFTPLESHDIFVNAARSRTTNCQTVSFVSRLPQSLRVLGYSTPLSERQRLKIIDTLSLPSKLKVSI